MVLRDIPKLMSIISCGSVAPLLPDRPDWEMMVATIP